MGQRVDERRFQAKETAFGIKSQYMWGNRNPFPLPLSLTGVESY